MLARLSITWVFNSLALLVASWLLSGVTYGDQWWTLLLAAIVFTLINTFIKPILAILSIPFIIVTLGIFYFLINIGMLYLTAWIVPDFDVGGFWSAAGAAIIVSITNWILHSIFGDPRDRERPESVVVVYD